MFDTYSFNDSSIYYVAGTVLNTESMAVSKIGQVPAYVETIVWWGGKLLNTSLLKCKSDMCYEGTI